jgi:acetylornithine deacetylase/succinyl-diaminopimelate desuccinylase-like protein
MTELVQEHPPAADGLLGEETVRFTAELIRMDTANRGGGDCRERPAAEYVAALLAEAGLDPLLLEPAPGRANVVVRIAGSEPALPGLLVHGHLDVVPAEPADWSVHPFSGEIRDGLVWGRGAIDMKGMDAMMAAVARAWAREGRGPRRDVVLAFTADEEDSAEAGSGWLAERHSELFEGCTEAIGESGGFTVHTAAGRLYPVGAGERGTAWLRLTAAGRAGHGSKPNLDNAVTRLSAAMARIGTHRWPVRITPTVRAALLALAEATATPLDPGCLDDPGGSGVDDFLGRLDPAAAALVAATVRNSANPTMLEAGYKANVVPGTAVGVVDGRVLPGAEEEFQHTIDALTGPDVTWLYQHRQIALQAPVDSPTFAALRDVLLAHDPGAHVVPYCLSGGTDAKQFSRLGISGYGFSPLKLPPGFDYHGLYHGVDERVPVDALRFGARVLDGFLSAVG